MKITSLKVENFKSIGSLEMFELPNLIVIAGPNGSGKTALFDAIRIYKEALAGYSMNSRGNHWVNNILNQIGPVVSIGSPTATVEAEVSVLDTERALIEMPVEHSGTLKVQVTITAATAAHGSRESVSVTTGGEDIQLLRNLFGDMYRPGIGIGVIDHIGPDRRFNPQQVGSISFSNDQVEGDLHRLVWNSSDKFSKLAEDLVWMRVVDLQEESTRADPPHLYIDGVKSIFSHFLPDKEFLGVEIPVDLAGPPQIKVRSSGVDHDINQLSSGQREVLMTYTHLQKLRPTGSIILFDEPELHLHPALQRRVISHLQELLDGGGNQIWVITHSEEIVDSTPFDNLYSMTGLREHSILPVKDRADRIELLQNLGARVAIQLTSPRILFLEGDSDAELLPLMVGGLPDSVSVVSTSGKGNLMRVAPAALEVLEQAIIDGQFFMVRDRDIEDDQSIIDELECRYQGNFFTWDRYHIENYLLDEEAIHSVLSNDPDVRGVPSRVEIGAKLRELADENKKRVIAGHVQAEVNRMFRKRIVINFSEGIKESLQKSLERRYEEIGLYLQDAKFADEIRRQTESLEARWENEWVCLCIGRDVLNAFHREIVKNQLGYEVFRNRIARELSTSGKTPSRVSEIVMAITQVAPTTSGANSDGATPSLVDGEPSTAN